MVNRELRDKAALLIRQYLACKITNLDFIDEFPRDRNDKGLKAMEERLWLYYDDESEEHCSFQPDSPVESLWLRCALFLDSSYEYEWGEMGHHNDAHPMMAILNGDIFRIRAIRNKKKSSNYSVWPFSRKIDFEQAKVAFGQSDLRADDEFPELQSRKSDQLRKMLYMVLSLIQTLAFFAGIFFVAYSSFGTTQYWGLAFLCVVGYFVPFFLIHALRCAE